VCVFIFGRSYISDLKLRSQFSRVVCSHLRERPPLESPLLRPDLIHYDHLVGCAFTGEPGSCYDHIITGFECRSSFVVTPGGGTSPFRDTLRVDRRGNRIFETGRCTYSIYPERLGQSGVRGPSTQIISWRVTRSSALFVLAFDVFFIWGLLGSYP
jgi:hypothetical protein